MYPFEAFEEEIKERLSLIVKNIKLELPPEEIADMAFPCFSLAREWKKSPEEIANEIAEKIERGEYIERIEAVKGYVNFFIDSKKLANETIKSILKMKDKFGSYESNGIKIIVEHTSANPNGPLHVGRARNPIIGDTIARILKFGGYDVTTQYYVDDMGKQVAALFWGTKNLSIESKATKPDHKYVVYYQEATKLMEKNEKVKEEIEEIIMECERGNKELLEEIKKVYQPVLEGILASLKRLNISIDEFVEESKFVIDGSVYEVIEKLASMPQAGREGKAIYLMLDEFGIHGRNKKFYLTRSNGTSLYAARDIAYHIWKGERADIMINVLGEDHKLEAKQVEIALKLLKKKVPEAIFYSFVSLPEGRMSTRRGRVVYLDDLIEEALERAMKEVEKRGMAGEKAARIANAVAMGAIRYNIIKVSPDKAIVFKWEDALNFEGESAPFIQYAHARCSSILKKAEFEEKSSYEFEHPSEIRLIKTLAKFPYFVKKSISSRNPSLIANYAFQLASHFNAFYRDCRVIGSDKQNDRLALVKATKQVIKNSLNLLGIEALEEM
ncbi:MAG: arginine--tRNA ligase [Thermoplasmata archaeon]|nr:arginine--tRNA ligase [Thermoplasmata archaeon]